MSKLRNVSEEILVGAKFVEVGKSAKLTRGQLLASKNVSLNLKKTETQYYVSQSKEELIGGYWVNILPENYSGYVWTRIKYTYTNGKSTYTNPTYNLKESDVDTSFETVPHYLATSQSTGVTKNTQGWTTTVQSMTAVNKYLWYYETIIFSTGEGSDSDCFIVGVYGDKGDTGATGATGVSITATTDLYAVNNSSSTAPSSGWDTFDNVKGQLSSSNQYLWNNEIVTYSTGNTSELTPHLIYRLSIDGQNGQDGKDGKDGVDGQDGQDGIGISGIEEAYSYGTASVSSGNWGSDPLIPSSTTGQNYVWQRERVVFDTSPVTYGSWSTPHMIAMWIKGDTGTPAYVFDIHLNTETYIRNLRLSGNNPISVSVTVILQGYGGTATVTITTSSGSTITPSKVGNTYNFNVPYVNNYDNIVITATHSEAGTITKTLSVIDETDKPLYLGELSAIPVASTYGFNYFVEGDYFLCSSTFTDSSITYSEGVPYEYGGNGWNNPCSFASAKDMSKAMNCLGGALKSNVVIPSVSAVYAWFQNLGAQNAFIMSLTSQTAFLESLFANAITIQTGGYIKGGGRYTATGAVSSWSQNGFWFSADGRLKANLQSDDNYNTYVGTGVATTNSLAGNYNTACGYETMNKVASGAGYNVSMGYRSLYSLTTGDYNVAIGYQALYSEQAGSYNTAIGYRALYSNHASSKGHNTAIGVNAMYSTISGMNNVAIGESALYLGLYADKNVAVGLGALYKTTNGAENVAIGYQAMLENVGGNYNIGIGTQALSSSSGGNYNIGIGWNALAYGRGSNNIGIGFNSLNTITTGKYNIGIGFSVTEQASAGGYYQMNINDSLIYREYSNTRTASEIAINLGKYYSSSVGARTVGAMGVFDGKAVTYIRFETSSQVKIGTTSGEYSLNYGGNGSTTYSGRTMLLFINPSIAGGGRLDCLEPEETSGGAGEPT